MASKNEAHARINNIKAELQSISTCSNATVSALQEILSKKEDEPPQKENLKGKTQTTARRRAATGAAADVQKQKTYTIAPREKYILATEVANKTLQTLAEALKSPIPVIAARLPSKSKPTPTEDARKPARPGQAKTPPLSQQPLRERSASQVHNSPHKRAPRRSSSYSSFLSPGPDPGLVATAECARTAFAFLGTPEATKVLGKDTKELQYENGVLALTGKLVAHGLDNMAVKELRTLKRRLDRHIGRDTAQQTGTADKESLASLLEFAAIDPNSPIVSLVTSFQSYALRIIAKLKRPRTIEATWEFLKPTNPSSPANLLLSTAKSPASQAKAARQLESLAQTILSLCPSISSADDANTLQPSAEKVLLLQHLAFSVRKQWWGLVNHQSNEEQELSEPFAKCLIAFGRRSQLIPIKKYKLAETLYTDLLGWSDSATTSPNGAPASATASKTLSSFAQAAGLSDQALRWLGSSTSSTTSKTPAVKQTARTIRIATITIEAHVKGEKKTDLNDVITNALDALNGSLGGSAADLESLFAEVNALRRAATKILIARLSKPSDDDKKLAVAQQAVSVIAASIHFSARFLGTAYPHEADSKTQCQHHERVTLAWKYMKGTIDSVMACCKQSIKTEDEWKDYDILLQECSHVLRRFEEEVKEGTISGEKIESIIGSYVVKLSNGYWALYMQLRRARCKLDTLVMLMRRSIDLVQSRDPTEQESGLLSMKLEQLGETLEDLGQIENSRDAFRQCIQSHLTADILRRLSEAAAKSSLSATFNDTGPFSVIVRLLKGYHHSFLKFGIRQTDEVAYFDIDTIHADVEGAILELQLHFNLRTLSKNRKWDSNLDKSIRSLIERLRVVYVQETYPVRRLRASIAVLQLLQSDPQILSQDNQTSGFDWDESIGIEQSQDQALKGYQAHLKALYELKSSMQQSSPPTSTLQQCFATWESLVTSASSWDILSDRIDDIDVWLKDLHACVEYLNAKGEEYLALPLLHLLVNILELQKNDDGSKLLITLCALGLQLLRLGYTGKAGLCLAKAEALSKSRTCSVDARLEWHIAYAEYLLGPTTTLSGRLRFNRIVADASYVHSLFATATGSYKEAARHVRQCITLNRRTWAALESRSNAKKAASADELESEADGSSRTGFDPLSSLRIDKGVPVVMSVTHGALSGPDFWALVPSMYRALMQQSQIFAHQGLLHEAIYIAEQAEKVASATQSATLMTDNASWRADCWAQSNRPDKAEAILKSLDAPTSRKCLSTAGYYSAVARTHHWNGQYEQEIASYNLMEQLLKDLSSPTYVKTLESFSAPVDALTDQLSSLTVDTTKVAKVKPATRGRKPAAKVAPRTTAKSATGTRPRAATTRAGKTAPKPTRQPGAPPASEESTTADQCAGLYVFQASMRDRAVLANILHDDLAEALKLLGQAEDLQNGLNQEVSHMWATFKARLAQSAKQIAEDFTVNTLPESTIAFPAFGLKDRRLSEVELVKKGTLVSSAISKSSRAKKQQKEDFMDTLREARERLVEAHALCATNGSNHLFRQTSMALGHVTVLMSAVAGSDLPGSLHPMYAAYMSELPKVNALRLVQESTEAEKEQISRDECMQWPVTDASSFSFASVSEFQKDYVDIIPETWNAVSLALSEARDELFITRFEKGLSPFVLRLPLARHASRDMDEDEFSFDDGKRDFDEIIELSDFSTRSAKDMTSREARQQWWAEREALDTRLHELLINMENIWLGGFKGVFSQHERQPALLAEFRKSLENILNEHLPSRKKKSQQKRPVLDARVLELFIGLGDATDEELDLDEALMDLIYFVVDILQFNGERNAYDELDFDAMVVETYEALRAYHSASHKLESACRHTILILDKDLHGFPWESLPCLEQLSISRLPSLAALRERLLSARPCGSKAETAPAGHYICSNMRGTSMLNPSGDLAHTSKTMAPRLDQLEGSWDRISSRAPSEKEFENSLREKDLVLYFGHGSGAQYVKSKAVRRLYAGQGGEEGRKAGCATTLLFGCSSVHLSENGIFEPSGMLASYLTAGAPAVVGMLWDVTDKDCDRFAVKAGELWGLWPERQDDSGGGAAKSVGKTAAKKAKGKGRAGQLMDEADGVGSGGSAKKGKKSGRAAVGLDEALFTPLTEPTPPHPLATGLARHTAMTERPPKSGSSRKRALVSCDRCKIRRARCIRDNADMPCADCKASGVACESKLPRKQRVYGSVETLSLRYRALEALVKGLFPNDNVQDTETLFRIAAARNITMPANDDFTPANIFNTTATATDQRSSSSDFPSIKSKHNRPSTLSDPQRPPSRSEELLRASRRTSHYFGPSSSFRLATTIRALAARWISITGASAHSFISDPSSHSDSILKRSSTDPSHEDLTLSETIQLPLSGKRSRKRSRSELDDSSDEFLSREHSLSRDSIGTLLPPKATAEALASAYFSRIHMYMPLFNRSVFYLRMEATYSRKAELIDECKDIGWLVALALVFSFGCQQLDGLDSKQARELRVKYLKFSKNYFRRLLVTACLDNATTMGMHRDASNKEFEFVERNIRRQVWWTIYIFEKTLCSILGRPTAIDDREMSLHMPEFQEFGQPSISGDSASLCFDLVRLSYSVRQRAYFDQTSAEERSPTPAVAKALLRELDAFIATVPPNMSLDCYPLTSEHRSMALLLHIYYYHTRCMVTRDFLVQKIESSLSFLENEMFTDSDDWRTTLALAEDCVESVHKSLQCIRAGIELGIIGYSWLDFYYVFHSIMIVCADFLARSKGQVESTKDTERKTTVRAVLDQIRDMQTLAPTYKTLSRIALQFANITEVAADRKSPTPTDTPHDAMLESVAPAASDAGVEHVMQLADLGEDWFTNATADLGLDFFDLGHVTNPVAFAAMPDAPSGAEQTIESANNDVEDWTSKTLKGLHTI
ncbi:separin [Bipolaris maydis]|nr:separin [Bipolaris maydis]KAJ6207599.1 separin [Bipolaris maydis]